MPKNSPQPSFKYQVHQTLTPRLAPLSAAVGGVLTAGTLQAATITVTTLQDGLIDGACSLRSALYASTRNSVTNGCSAGDAGQDTIEFTDGLQGTINLLPSPGGLYYDGSTLPIGESVVIEGGGNITLNGSGAAPVLYAQNGGVYTADSVDLSGLTITGGGGVRGAGLLSRVRYLSISDSIITGNEATDAGGGIWHVSGSTGSRSFFISDTEISNNSVTASDSLGGGIYSNEYTQLFDSVVSGNESGGDGGGIAQVNGSSVRLLRTTLSDNAALDGNGGAVSMYNGPGANSRFTSTLSQFNNNSAAGDGGAVALIETNPNAYDGRARILGTRFTGNDAGGDGGALFVTREGRPGGDPEDFPNQLTIQASTDGSITLFSANTAAGQGGGVYFNLGENFRTIVEDTNFIGNQASDGGGGGAFVQASTGGMSISRAVFSGNRATAGGGGGLIASIQDGGNFAASGITSYANVAENDGGGISLNMDRGELLMSDSYIASNASLSGYGGGMTIQGSPRPFDLERLIITDNSAELDGGGLDVFADGGLTGNSFLDNSEISNNQAGGNGGGISIFADGEANVFVRNSTISGNSASTGGGLSVTGYQTFSLKYSTIAYNTADDEGGGMVTSLSDGCSVESALFDFNTGGASAATQDLRIRGVGAVECDVSDTLLAGNASEFNKVSGNVLGQASLIGPLADNGGSGGRTHALPANSPAIDASVSSGVITPSNDQRGDGFPREFGDRLDIGAFELSPTEDRIFRDNFESP